MSTLKTVFTSCFSMIFILNLFAQNDEPVMMEELEVVGYKNAQRPNYQASPTRVLDIIHMDLSLNIDWDKQQLPGKATITCTPYFNALDTIVLDAKGLDVSEVAIIRKGKKQALEFVNTGLHLKIALDQTHTREDTLDLFIDYVSKPDELEIEGGSAITDAKGLYFINADGKDKTKMKHLWTQGEPESNSAWFPTIDKPNERFTHEIDITLDNSLKSISNGLLDFKTDNGDGTRTDYWVMDKPHAPYLVMIAVGPFAEVKDSWKDLDVNYYVEENWKDSAQRIFGKTPEMLTFYSELLGVEYPWQKYDQVVVREYVSGAMENTTAVIFGDFMYTDKSAYNDDTHEDVVAHELFHHWFGDLVTCESWGNLPLNESFATYGEYLWIDHKYGNNEAEWHLKTDLENYMYEYNSGYQEKLIRTDFDRPVDMFDSHSYAKGGRVLHMLRHYLGDEMFFEGLRVYLEDNKYQSVEIHNLRMAFEKVSGQDLNWFFNQWFLAIGHPKLEVSYSYNNATREQSITIKQVQDLKMYPLYLLHNTIDIYTQSGIKSYPIVIDQQEQTFTYKVEGLQPKLVTFNSDQVLLGEVEEIKPESFWIHQLSNATKLFDRVAAIEYLGTSSNVRLKTIAISYALKDDFWGIRELGLGLVLDLSKNDASKLQKDVANMAKKDSSYTVRAGAIFVLSAFYNKAEVKLYKKSLSVPSYEVKSEALGALGIFDTEFAIEECKTIIKENQKEMIMGAMWVLLDNGTKSELKLMYQAIENATAEDKMDLFYFPAQYAVNHPEEQKKALALLEMHTLDDNEEVAEMAQLYIDWANKKLSANKEETAQE